MIKTDVELLPKQARSHDDLIADLFDAPLKNVLIALGALELY